MMSTDPIILLKEILTKSCLTDIIQNYSQLITEEKEYTELSASTGQVGKKRTKKEKKLKKHLNHILKARFLAKPPIQTNYLICKTL
jgi:hypothetical protein